MQLNSITIGKQVCVGTLDLRMQAFLPELDRQLALRKLPCLLYFGRRTALEQSALYAQGRMSLDIVNTLRKGAGMPPLLELDNKHTVTKARAGQSAHEYGMAIDLVPLGKGGKPLWGRGVHWTTLGEAIVASGLEWGGLFGGGTAQKPSDGPHAQLPGWKALAMKPGQQ
jgi:peptidoglycan LD-endopeptidase CwlK